MLPIEEIALIISHAGHCKESVLHAHYLTATWCFLNTGNICTMIRERVIHNFHSWFLHYIPVTVHIIAVLLQAACARPISAVDRMITLH